MLLSCSKKPIYNCQLPLHRLNIIEKPICKKEKYIDLVNCLILYHEKLEESNRDKESILRILGNNKWRE